MGWGHVSPEKQTGARSGRDVLALLNGQWGQALPAQLAMKSHWQIQPGAGRDWAGM